MIQWSAFTAYVEKAIHKMKASGQAVNINFENNITIHEMRKNQFKVYTKYGSYKFVIVSEPTGSGKSTTIKFVFAMRLTEDENHKLLIAVPQSLIAKSFGRTLLKYPDGKEIEWDIGLNLCQDIKGKKSKRTINFLNKRKFTKGIHNRTGIITHYGLAVTLSDKTDEEIIEYFKNTTLIVDEAHHILYPPEKNGQANEETASANILGRIISILLEKGNSSTGIWLPTATFYRGDSGPILSNEQINKFKVHHLPFDQHWRENIKYIDTFEFNFVVYKDNIFQNIKELLQQKRKKTIIHCPYNGRLLNGKSKEYFKNRLIYTIRDVWPDAKICDLVKVNNREKQKNLLYDEITAESIDSILTVKIFDEGSDWKYAEQTFDLAPSSSLRVEVQRLGRLWRDIPGKNHIAYYVFLPHRDKFKDDEEKRNHFSDSFNALAGSMIIHELIKPVKYPDSKRKTIDGNKVNALDSIVPNLSKKQELLKDVQIELIKLRSIKEPTLDETKEKIREVISEKYQIADEDFSVTNQILGMIKRSISSISNNPLRPTWKNQGIDLTWMKDKGYDKVELKDMYDNLLMFGTAISGVETFQEFRDVYGNYKSISEWVEFAKDLANKNGGILPEMSKLPAALVVTLLKYPEQFEGIQQYFKIPGSNNERFIKTIGVDVNQIILTKRKNQVKQLLDEDGILPCHGNLIKTEANITVANYVRANPKDFDGIKQYFGYGKNRVIITINQDIITPCPDNSPLTKTINKHVKEAKKLEAKLGAVPSIATLKDLNKSALASIISQFPEYFGDIKIIFGENREIISIKDIVEKRKQTQESRKIKDQQIKQISEEEEKYHQDMIKKINNIKDSNGVIPTMGALSKDNPDIHRYIRSNIKRVTGIKQYKGRGHSRTIITIGLNKTRSAPDISLVNDAKELAKLNNNIIPSFSELDELGRSDITSLIQRQPHLFNNLKQKHIVGNRGKYIIRTIGEDNAK